MLELVQQEHRVRVQSVNYEEYLYRKKYRYSETTIQTPVHQYSTDRNGTTSGSPLSTLFRLSLAHLSNHLLIRPLPASLPTLTVAIILPHSKLSAKQLSSVKLECSEYGTPYSVCFHVELRMGLMDVERNVRRCCLARSECRAGVMLMFSSEPAGGAYVHPVGRKASARLKWPLNWAR